MSADNGFVLERVTKKVEYEEFEKERVEFYKKAEQNTFAAVHETRNDNTGKTM